MLNLAEIKEEYFDVKLSKKQVLHLRKPSKALYDDILKLTKNINSMSNKEEYEATISLGVKILNRNIEGLDFNNDSLDFAKADRLVAEYTLWVMNFLKANSKN